MFNVISTNGNSLEVDLPLMPGMHFRILALPGNVPDTIVNDRLWWRAFRTSSYKDVKLGILEVHSSTTNRKGSRVEISPVTGTDLVPVLHPSMKAAVDAGITVDIHDINGLTVLAWPLSNWLATAVGFEKRIQTTCVIDNVKCRVEIMARIPWRAPFMTLETAITPLDGTRSIHPTTTTVRGFNIVDSDHSNLNLIGIGQLDWSDLVCVPEVVTEDAETTYAINNATIHPAIVKEWKYPSFLRIPKEFMNALYGKGNLAVLPKNPDDPGAHAEYGITSFPFLFGDGSDPKSLRKLLSAANSWCNAQNTWYRADGQAVPLYSMTGNLTFEEGYPWIDNRSDPYDDLGYQMPRGSQWYVDLDHQPADSEHVSMAPLATAIALAGKLRHRIVGQSQLRILPYTRAYHVTLTEPNNDWTPGGRRGARPGLALFNLALAFESCGEVDTAIRTCELWCDVHRRSILKKKRAVDKPQQFSGYPVGDVLTGYENGILAMFGMLIHRLTKNENALFVALYEGRCCMSQFHCVGGEWLSAYNTPITSDGSAPATGWTSASYYLRRWSLAGVVAYAYAMRNSPPDSVPFITFRIWLQVGLLAWHALQDVPETQFQFGEFAAYFNMVVPSPDWID